MREAARQDYLDGRSYRSIAARYGISIGLVAKWAKADGWEQPNLPPVRAVVKREQKRERSREKREHREHPGRAQEEPQEPVVLQIHEEPEESLPDYDLLRESALLALERINQRLRAEKPLEPRDIKSITGALLDLKNQLNALSPRELREMALRLRSLEKQAETTQAEPVVVTFVNREWEDV